MYIFKILLPLNLLLFIGQQFSLAQTSDKISFDKVSKSYPIQIDWYTYNDAYIGGKSIGNKILIKEKEYKNQYMMFSYKLNKDSCLWAPYAALSCNINSYSKIANVQAISYRFKGDAHMFIAKTSNIKDFCYYNITIPASDVWTTVTIPLTELKQPTWGLETVFEISKIVGFSWQVVGNTNDTGFVSIDDLTLLLTPQLAINPVPFPNKGATIDSIHTIYSNILKENRNILVYLPPSYNKQKKGIKTYPVVYVLDGEWYQMGYLGNLIEKLSLPNYDTVFPEMIVVGITNTNRTRDLTPTYYPTDPWDKNSTRFAASGGGGNFMDFIEKELMPMIENKYSTSNYKTFVGHSLGGLTVINTIIHYPQLFDAYIALDPSLWWDNQLLIKQANDRLGNLDLINKKLYIAIANTMYKGIDTSQVISDSTELSVPLKSNLKFIDALEKNNANGLIWKYDYFSDKDHQAVVEPGELNGFKYLFELNQSKVNQQFIFNETNNGLLVTNLLATNNMGYTVNPPEKIINNYAYYYLNKKNIDIAYSLFFMNLHNYPSSPYVYDAMGDYYLAIGDFKNAKINFLQALLLSENVLEVTKRKLKELEAKSD